MKHYSIRRVFALAVIIAVIGVTAFAATDYLWAYRSFVSEEAVEISKTVDPVAELSDEDLSLYRLGFAAGYDYAINHSDEHNSISRTNPNRDDYGYSYVLNTNTHKFHLPTCTSVNDISNKNLQPTNKSREEIIGMGFQPCKKCNP